jgi:hypothetical protein
MSDGPFDRVRAAALLLVEHALWAMSSSNVVEANKARHDCGQDLLELERWCPRVPKGPASTASAPELTDALDDLLRHSRALMQLVEEATPLLAKLRQEAFDRPSPEPGDPRVSRFAEEDARTASERVRLDGEVRKALDVLGATQQRSESLPGVPPVANNDDVEALVASARAAHEQQQEKDRRQQEEAETRQQCEEAFRDFTRETGYFFSNPDRFGQEPRDPRPGLIRIFERLSRVCDVFRRHGDAATWECVDQEATLAHYRGGWTKPDTEDFAFRYGCRLLDRGFSGQLRQADIEWGWQVVPLRGCFNHAQILLGGLLGQQRIEFRNAPGTAPTLGSSEAARPEEPAPSAPMLDEPRRSEDIPGTLDGLLGWLSIRVQWLRSWHLADDPKPIPPPFLDEIIRLFGRGSGGVPVEPEARRRWANERIWRYSERTIHQTHECLERLGILDAPVRQSLNPLTNDRCLIEALDHLTALRAFVARRLTANPTAVPANPQPAPPANTADGTNDRLPVQAVDALTTAAQSPPNQYLLSWRDILDALEQKNNAENQRNVRKLNEQYEGPIVLPRKGGQPKVSRDRLLTWWNRLEERFRDIGQREADARATLQARHRYGKDGEVLPDISGGIKKRRGKEKGQ